MGICSKRWTFRLYLSKDIKIVLIDLENNIILIDNEYPWGSDWEMNRTNLWQGVFPYENQLRDGYDGLSPVNSFKAQNQYEMYTTGLPIVKCDGI